MKLHKIEIENLNSLHGHHEIDFDEELAGAPLFLIMGATGAGKTTILDAVCLTLFGTTPRVRDEGGHTAVARPAERMMTKGTWYCRAMLEFSLLDDQGVRQRYRAEWRCERTHKSPTGNVKNPERSLLRRDGGSWENEPLASGDRLKDYEAAFNEVLRGMTEDSFLRSVLLAQGQFSAFLKADEKEKAAILERLTRTNEYKRIGERAGVVKRAKEKRVQKIDDLLDELPEVDAGSVEELEEAVEKVQKEEASKKKALDKVRGHVEWLEADAKLRRALAGAKEQVGEAHKKRDAHKDDADKLALARRARPVEKYLDEVRRLDAERGELRETKPDLEEAVEQAEETLKTCEARKGDSLDKLTEARAARKERLPEIRKARELRVEKRGATEAFEEAKKTRDAILRQLRTDADDAESVEEVRASARARLEERETAVVSLEEHAAEAKGRLEGLLDGSEQVGERRRELRETITKLQAKRDQLLRACTQTEKRVEVADELAKAKRSAEQLDTRIEELEAEKSKLEERVDARQELVEAREGRCEDIKRALALSSHRQSLAAEEPCPLCGSQEHPYLEAGTHEEADARLDKERREREEKLAEAKAKLEKAADEASKIATKLAVAAEKRDGLEASAAQLEDKLEAIDERLDEALEAAGVELEEGAAAADAIAAALTAIEGEQEQLNEQAAKLDQADEAAQKARKALVEARASIEKMRQNLDRLDAAIKATDQKREKVAGIDRRIDETLEGKDPEEVDSELCEAVEAAEKAHKAAHSAQTTASEKAKLARQKLADTKERLEKIGEKLVAQRDALAEKLAEQEFADVDELEAALLTGDEFETLREQLEAVEQAFVRAKDRLEDVEGRIEAHRQACPEELDPDEAALEELKARAETLDEAYKEVNQRLGQLREKLSTRRGELERRREFNDERARLVKDLEVWQRIYSLIGVNNGGAFQKYAQALNLRELIHRANEHLQKLAPRYSLDVAEDDGTPLLDFTVCDGHHAGAARSLSTLSGGETFLVSLAMALALADYRRLDLRMETLLLDEGFGTLDQDTLAKALSLLNNLHLEGDRQVGLISHVEGLKERIPYRIEVQKLGDGRSSVEVVGGHEASIVAEPVS